MKLSEEHLFLESLFHVELSILLDCSVEGINQQTRRMYPDRCVVLCEVCCVILCLVLSWNMHPQAYCGSTGEQEGGRCGVWLATL